MDVQSVLELCFEVLGERPVSAERMTLTHSGNTIYDVTLPDRHVIARLRGPDKDTLSRTTHNLRAMAQLGLPVPRVLAADTSRTRYPFRYILLEKMPGRDLLYELPQMTPVQITRLAEQIVSIQRAVMTLPRGTGFGWGHVGEEGTEPYWFDVFRTEADAIPPPSDGTRSGDFRVRLHHQQSRFQPYFRQVAPICFLEDLTTKNVLLEHGELQGIIDFDGVCFGDPFWMIGLAAGCIVNDIGAQCLFYTDELCRCWNLTDQQRQVVIYYAAQRANEFRESALIDGDTLQTERLTDAMDNWLGELESDE